LHVTSKSIMSAAPGGEVGYTEKYAQRMKCQARLARARSLVIGDRHIEEHCSQEHSVGSIVSSSQSTPSHSPSRSEGSDSDRASKQKQRRRNSQKRKERLARVQTLIDTEIMPIAANMDCNEVTHDCTAIKVRIDGFTPSGTKANKELRRDVLPDKMVPQPPKSSDTRLSL